MAGMNWRHAAKVIVVGALAMPSCASMLAQQYDDDREECRQKYSSGSDDRQECLDAAREKYEQKSTNLRQTVRGMQGQ